MKLRGESIRGQLEGTIPSTESEQRNSTALIDASSIDLSVMVSMNMGGGGFSFGGRRPEEAGKENTPKADTASSVTTQASNTPPKDFDVSQFGGDMPEGFDTSKFGENASNTPNTSQAVSASSDENGSGRPSRDNFPGGQMNGSSQGFSGSSLALWRITLLVLTAAILFAVFYRRKPRKR